MDGLQKSTESRVTNADEDANVGDGQEQNNNNVIPDIDEGAVGGASSKEIPILRPEQLWTEEELDRDPHRMCFYDAYRSAASSPEPDEEKPACGSAKPLNLTDDWDMWDYMDEDTLRQRLQHHPLLLEQITRNRKRRAAAALEGASKDDDELCAVMERHAKVTKFNEHTTVC